MRILDQFFNTRPAETNAHEHRQLFENGESEAMRRNWLRAAQATCHAKGIQFTVREEDGGFAFGFRDLSSYASFVRHVYGDLENPGQHTQTHHSKDFQYLVAFKKAAEIHLRELGIPYRSQLRDDNVHFKFDRFSDRIRLAELIENGSIDATVRAMQARERTHESSLIRQLRR